MVPPNDWQEIESHIRDLMRLMLPDDIDNRLLDQLQEFLQHREYVLALHVLSSVLLDQD